MTEYPSPQSSKYHPPLSSNFIPLISIHYFNLVPNSLFPLYDFFRPLWPTFYHYLLSPWTTVQNALTKVIVIRAQQTPAQYVTQPAVSQL